MDCGGGGRNDLILTHPWGWPDEIDPCPIQTILLDENQDHGKSTSRPSSKKARDIVNIAHNKAEEMNSTGDWTISEHLSRKLLENPTPRSIAPELTFAKQQGTWTGSR